MKILEESKRPNKKATISRLMKLLKASNSPESTINDYKEKDGAYYILESSLKEAEKVFGIRQSENQIQIQLVATLRAKGYFVAAVPNEIIKNPGKFAGSDFFWYKKGVVPGMPDLVIVKDGIVLFFEVKTLDGTLKDHQRKVAGHIVARGGHCMHGYGYKDCLQKIEAFFGS